MEQITVCSLFAGIGGIDIAFEQAGATIVLANEIDAAACKTYRANLPLNVLIEGDIRAIQPSVMPDFDILTAGFPCQPFSVCGAQKGFNDERGNLFFEIIRVINEKKPRVVFLENVANLVKHDDGKTFNVIQSSLLDSGYQVEYTVLDAGRFGIAQHRTRTYIVAFRERGVWRRFSFPRGENTKVTIMDVIDTKQKAYEKLYYSTDSSEYRALADVIDDPTQMYRFGDRGIQKSKDGLALTLKANMGTWDRREPIIKDAFGIRKLSPKECLTLQGYPDSYAFPAINNKEAYKQAGNTVCVPVIRKIAEQILAALKLYDDEKVLHIGQTLWWCDKKNRTTGTVIVTGVSADSFEVRYLGQKYERNFDVLGDKLFKQPLKELKTDGLKAGIALYHTTADDIPF